MGLLDAFRPKQDDVRNTRAALDEAAEERPSNAIDKVIATIVDVGIDGKGPFKSARQVAERALTKQDGRPEAAIDAIVGSSRLTGAVGGFVTGLGGFITMPVALPANVLEFYVQATRMVAAIASLRGYDVDEPRIRTAVLLTLVGSDAQDVLKKAGVNVAGGALTSFALERLPRAALMMVNKAVGFRLLRGIAERFLTRLGRMVPLVGGLIGAGLDGWMMHRIAVAAKREFPTVQPT